MEAKLELLITGAPASMFCFCFTPLLCISTSVSVFEIKKKACNRDSDDASEAFLCGGCWRGRGSGVDGCGS